MTIDRRCIVLAIDRIYHPAMHPCFRPSSVSLPHLVFTYHRAPSLLYSPLHLVYTVQSTHLLFDFALDSRCLHRHIYVSFYPLHIFCFFSPWLSMYRHLLTTKGIDFTVTADAGRRGPAVLCRLYYLCIYLWSTSPYYPTYLRTLLASRNDLCSRKRFIWHEDRSEDARRSQAASP